MASVRDPAEVKATAQHREAKHDTVPSNRPKAKRGAALAASVGPVSAKKALARREMALIDADGGEEECAHVRSAAKLLWTSNVPYRQGSSASSCLPLLLCLHDLYQAPYAGTRGQARAR